jgi:Tfp pilus assembly protein PilF
MNNNDLNDAYTEAMTEFAAGNIEKSVYLLTNIIENDASHKLAFISRGSAFLKLSDSKKALSDFNRAIEIDPAYARAHHLRGLANEQLGNNEDALSDFDHSIELNPEYGSGYYSRATLRAKLGHEDLASEDIQMVAHLTNRNIEEFANDNNVWRSQHLRLESMLENELNR